MPPRDRFATAAHHALDLRHILSGTRCCETPAAACLTPRERDVMGGLALGLSRTDVAHRLDVSRRTVDRDVRSVLDKLGAPNPTVAVLVLVAAARRGTDKQHR